MGRTRRSELDSFLEAKLHEVPLRKGSARLGEAPLGCTRLRSASLGSARQHSAPLDSGRGRWTALCYTGLLLAPGGAARAALEPSLLEPIRFRLREAGLGSSPGQEAGTEAEVRI